MSLPISQLDCTRAALTSFIGALLFSRSFLMRAEEFSFATEEEEDPSLALNEHRCA
jgi:hypothetical protein